MALLISMPMFSDEPVISIEKLEKYIVSNWDDVTKFKEKEVSDCTVSFIIDKASVAIGIMRAPIPWDDLEGPCATSILWPNSKEELEKQQHHLIVTVISEELTAIELSTLLTQVTAALMAVTTGALGVYWCNATMIIPREFFIECSIEVLPFGPPVDIWVDFRIGADENAKSSGFTTGLAALGLMEIESVNSPEPVEKLNRRLTALSEYIIINGLIIEDGDTIGEDENEIIKIFYEKSSFGHKDQVLSLNYSQAK